MRGLILLSLFAFAVASERTCGENQRYLQCGTACPLTCENFANPPKICPAMCVSGCHCEKGYVKTEDGRCVRPEECPSRINPVCGENQRFEECGTACPLTCDNYDNPPKICPAMCVIGCHCEKGYVKTRDGRCVRPEECPSRSNAFCGKNQRYDQCGTACPLTCDNYENPPKICPAMCVSGCHCEEGYVKTKNGRCVRPEKCPPRRKPVCGKNQRFEECGTACPLTCENFENPPKICPAMCVFGCHCENGYVKTSDGRCVRPEECPARPKQSSSDVCSLPAEPGVCDAYMPRYFFDTNMNECRRFIYGGCGGNENNFRTMEECMRACDKSIQL